MRRSKRRSGYIGAQNVQEGLSVWDPFAVDCSDIPKCSNRKKKWNVLVEKLIFNYKSLPIGPLYEWCNVRKVRQILLAEKVLLVTIFGSVLIQITFNRKFVYQSMLSITSFEYRVHGDNLYISMKGSAGVLVISKLLQF